MPFDDLRQWIAALDRAGQLKRIQTEADPILEIAEITDRVSKMHIGDSRPRCPERSRRGVRPAKPGSPVARFFSKTSRAIPARNF